jgi:hypothetical protein
MGDYDCRRIVELGGSYWLEYMNEVTGWLATKELSPSEVTQYEDLITKLQAMESDFFDTLDV